jgi:hypothetical protein
MSVLIGGGVRFIAGDAIEDEAHTPCTAYKVLNGIRDGVRNGRTPGIAIELAVGTTDHFSMRGLRLRSLGRDVIASRKREPCSHCSHCRHLPML